MNLYYIHVYGDDPNDIEHHIMASDPEEAFQLWRRYEEENATNWHDRLVLGNAWPAAGGLVVRQVYLDFLPRVLRWGEDCVIVGHAEPR